MRVCLCLSGRQRQLSNEMIFGVGTQVQIDLILVKFEVQCIGRSSSPGRKTFFRQRMQFNDYKVKVKLEETLRQHV